MRKFIHFLLIDSALVMSQPILASGNANDFATDYCDTISIHSTNNIDYPSVWSIANEQLLIAYHLRGQTVTGSIGDRTIQGTCVDSQLSVNDNGVELIIKVLKPNYTAALPVIKVISYKKDGVEVAKNTVLVGGFQ